MYLGYVWDVIGILVIYVIKLSGQPRIHDTEGYNPNTNNNNCI